MKTLIPYGSKENRIGPPIFIEGNYNLMSFQNEQKLFSLTKKKTLEHKEIPINIIIQLGQKVPPNGWETCLFV